MVKRVPAMWETRVRFLGREDPLEKEMAMHSSILAWKIPWTEEPDRLQSMGSQSVRHDWVTSLSFTFYVSSITLGEGNCNPFQCSCLENPMDGETWRATVQFSSVTQSCLALSDPMDCSLPGSSVHGIFQARVLEWVAIFFSRGTSWPRDRTPISHIVGRRFTFWATREATREMPKQRIK